MTPILCLKEAEGTFNYNYTETLRKLQKKNFWVKYWRSIDFYIGHHKYLQNKSTLQ